MNKPNRFRFRAWNKARCEMLSPYLRKGSTHNFLAVVDCESNSTIAQYLDTTKAPDEQDDYVLMQSTGLADKNGNEIFEGDIVRIIGSKQEPFDNVKLVDCFNQMFSGDGGLIAEAGFLGFSVRRYTVELIGNIYENPDLVR